MSSAYTCIPTQNICKFCIYLHSYAEHMQKAAMPARAHAAGLLELAGHLLNACTTVFRCDLYACLGMVAAARAFQSAALYSAVPRARSASARATVGSAALALASDAPAPAAAASCIDTSLADGPLEVRAGGAGGCGKLWAPFAAVWGRGGGGGGAGPAPNPAKGFDDPAAGAPGGPRLPAAAPCPLGAAPFCM